MLAGARRREGEGPMNGQQYVNELRRLRGQAQDLFNSLDRLLTEAEGVPDSGHSAEAERKAVEYDPTPKTEGDLVTTKQLGMIRALSREAGVDPDLECGFVMKVKTHELSKKAASAFIDHLQGLKQQKGAAA